MRKYRDVKILKEQNKEDKMDRAHKQIIEVKKVRRGFFGEWKMIFYGE